MQEQLYRAFSVGLDKRQLIKADDQYINKITTIIEKNPDGDYYESLYLYNQDHYNQFKKTHTLSGISDNVTDRIVFDFDSKDLRQSQNEAKELYSRLVKSGFNKNSITSYFSGNKGYHIELKTDRLLNRETLSTILDNLTEGLNTFDKSIRDNARIFRFPLTKHPKSNRYKIPLTEQELNELTTEEIQEIASDVSYDKDTILEIAAKEKTSIPSKTIIPTKKKKEVIVLTLDTEDMPDMSKRPKHLSPVKYVLQEGFFEEGQRNKACMILAATYRYLGYNKELAYNMIKATLRLRAARLGLTDYDRGELWKTVIEKVYSPDWDGGTYSEEEGLLKETIEKYQLDKIPANELGLVNLNSVSNYFKDFALNIDKNTIKLGIEELDKKLRVTTSMLVCLLAAPGAGKTSVSLGILNSVSKNNVKSIFFSLDMAIPQVYQRLLQKHTGHSGEEITDNYKFNKIDEIVKYEEALETNYKNVKFCFKSGITCDGIRQAVIHERDTTGVAPKLIVVDYLECVQGPYSDSNANKALVALQLKDIANEFGLCVFLLVQPTKLAGDPSAELNSYRGIKGSSVIEEQASVVITLYRPGFNPKDNSDDKFATITTVKNRMGELSTIDLGWNGLRGTLEKLGTDQKRDLTDLRSKIKQSKEESEEKSGSNWPSKGSNLF